MLHLVHVTSCQVFLVRRMSSKPPWQQMIVVASNASKLKGVSARRHVVQLHRQEEGDLQEEVGHLRENFIPPMSRIVRVILPLASRSDD